MSLEGDFGGLDAWGSQLAELSHVPERAAATATPEVARAAYDIFAPGAGNGYAPNVTARTDGTSIVIDAGSPARLPIGIPTPEGLDEILTRAAEAEFAKAIK